MINNGHDHYYDKDDNGKREKIHKFINSRR